MSRKYPNSSVLSIITQSLDNVENILFFYLKPVPDYYPFENIFWYNGHGKNGVSKYVWEKLAIKQWVAIGNDNQIDDLFDTIMSTSKITISERELKFALPQFQILQHNSNPLRDRIENKYDAYYSENNQLLPREFYEIENLEYLSGYKSKSDEIKPLYPLGLFEKDFISNNLKKNIFGIRQKRTPYLTFHGVQETSEKNIGSKDIVGFYQQKFIESFGYTAVVKNENNLEIGRALIDKTNGFFKIHLKEPTQKGKIEILVNENQEKVLEYVLLQDISINTHLADKSFKDSYGRTFLLSSEKERPTSITSETWHQNIYANTNDGNIKLSDLFKTLFDYLGSRILIADPYFINNIKQDNLTKSFSFTHCQTAFFNALFHSALDKGVDQLNILGCSRVTNQLSSDGEGLTKIELMFENYEKVLRGLINGNGMEKYLPKESIVIRRALEEFHNRYWFSLIIKDGIEVIDKCVIITNSIGNISELDLMPVTDENQLRTIVNKYMSIYKSSEIRLSV